MTDKELRGLSRAELLQMLIDLSKENEALKKDCEALRAERNAREIKIIKAGSIAEASLALNGVFEAAQAAAEQYLDNIKSCDAICQAKQAEAERSAEETLAAAKAEAARLVEDAKTQADAYWEDARRRIDGLCADFDGLRELLNAHPKENG